MSHTTRSTRRSERDSMLASLTGSTRRRARGRASTTRSSVTTSSRPSDTRPSFARAPWVADWPNEHAERLGRAGLRAHARGDWSATASLVTRSLELQPMDADGRSKLELALAEARLELAPAKPGLFRRMRCVVRVPPGHLWSVRERSGSPALRCRRCGREKRQRRTLDATLLPSDSQDPRAGAFGGPA